MSQLDDILVNAGPPATVVDERLQKEFISVHKSDFFEEYNELLNWSVRVKPAGCIFYHDYHLGGICTGIAKVTKTFDYRGLDVPKDAFHIVQVNSEEYLEVRHQIHQELVDDMSLSDNAKALSEPLLSNDPLPMRQTTLYKMFEQVRQNALDMPENDSMAYKTQKVLNYERYLENGGTKRYGMPKTLLPSARWFDPRVRKLKPEDIITILKENELEAFVQFIGRVIVGRSGALHMGESEPVSHSYRKMLHLYSRPGIGKSTLMEMITKSMRDIGITVAAFRDPDSRFDTYNMFGADFIYGDDMTENALKKLFKSDKIKQVVTGNSVIYTERKGKDGVYLIPQAAILCCTNQIDRRATWEADEGVLSRLQVLKAKNQDQLDNSLEMNLSQSEWFPEASTLTPRPYLEELAQKLDVDWETIMLWFLRLCVDRFLGIESHYLESEELDSRLAFKPSVRVIESLVRFNQLAIALRSGGKTAELNTNSKVDVYQMFSNYFFFRSDPSMVPIKARIKEDWETKNRPLGHPWEAISKISLSSCSNVNQNLQELMKSPQASAETMLKVAIEGLKTVEGDYPLSRDLHYCQALVEEQNCIESQEITCRKAQQLIQEMDTEIYRPALERMYGETGPESPGRQFKFMNEYAGVSDPYMAKMALELWDESLRENKPNIID